MSDFENNISQSIPNRSENERGYDRMVAELAGERGFTVIENFERSFEYFKLKPDSYLISTSEGERLLREHPNLLERIELGLAVHEKPIISRRPNVYSELYTKLKKEEGINVSIGAEPVYFKTLNFGGESRAYLITLPYRSLVVRVGNTDMGNAIKQSYCDEIVQMHELTASLGKPLKEKLGLNLVSSVLATQEFSVSPYIEGIHPPDTPLLRAKLYATYLAIRFFCEEHDRSDKTGFWKNVLSDVFRYNNGETSTKNIVVTKENELYFIDLIFRAGYGSIHPFYKLLGQDEQSFISLSENEVKSMGIDMMDLKTNMAVYLKTEAIILPIENARIKYDWDTAAKLACNYLDREYRSSMQRDEITQLISMAERKILIENKCIFYARNREFRQSHQYL